MEAVRKFPRARAGKFFGFAVAVAWLAVSAWGAYEIPNSAYAPPTSYYNAASGTGSTLRTNLHNIISTGYTGRTYGDFRYASALLDQDPNTPGNILLIYSRASVSSVWDTGTTWSREHQWCVSWMGTGDPTNTATPSAETDEFELRPVNPGVNSARSNNFMGLSTSSGTYGTPATNSNAWYPGDADAGEVARTFFYMATRYYDGSSKLSLTNLQLINTSSIPGYGSCQAGDLDSFLHWHYKFGVDNFERRRNQYIYGSTDGGLTHTLNPTYYQGNRNPYIDHPEYVWAVFGGTTNDSQLSVGSPNADGSSSATVSLGRVMRNGTLATAAVTLNKTGANPTTADITLAGEATCPQYGTGQSIDYGAQTLPLTVGLSSSTATTGLKSGTLTIDNTDLTTTGTGHGSGDGNDTISVSAAVLDKRVVTASSSTVAFGRVMANTAVASSVITLSTTGDDNNATRVNVAGTTVADANGIAVAGSSTLFNSASSTGTRTLTGTFASTGAKSGSLNLSVTTAETGLGDTYSPITLSYTATALAKRIVTPSTSSVAFGRVMTNTAVTSSAITLSTTGDDNNATRVNVVGTTVADSNGIAVAGSSTLFNSATATGTRTLSGSFVSTGAKSGSLNLSVATAETGLGDTYLPISLTYTATALGNRIVTASDASFGVVHFGDNPSRTTTLTTTGDDNHATRVTVAGTLFNSATSTATVSISPGFAAPGPVSANVVLTTTGEGLANESPVDVSVHYTASVAAGDATWASTADSSWSANANWADSAGVAAAPGLFAAYAATDTARFTGGGVTTISLNGATPSLKAFLFSGAAGYTIQKGTGAGSLTLNGGASAATITVSNAASHAITAPLTLGSALNVTTADPAGALSLGPLTVSSARLLTKAGPGTLTLANDAGSPSSMNLSLTASAGSVSFNSTQHLATLTLSGSSRASLPAGGGKVLFTAGGLAIAADGTGAFTAKLDLADNSLVARANDVGNWTGSAYTGVTGMVASGYNRADAAHLWRGAGIASSVAANDAAHNRGLGVMTAQQAADNGNATILTSGGFHGETVAPTDVLVEYGWTGDLNLDGAIDYLDYGVIDSAYLYNLGHASAPSRGYGSGDLNLDGSINYLDYGLLDSSFLASNAPSVVAAASAHAPNSVPEPAALALLSVWGLLLRRRA